MVKRQTGFTLTEVLVVLAISGVLAGATAPYATDFSAKTSLRHAVDTLNQSYQNGKSVALRNPLQVVESNPAAGLKLESGTLLLCQGSPTDANCTASGSRVVWEASIPSGVSIVVNGATMSTIRIDNNGGAIDDGGDVLTVAYSITSGGKNETGSLF